MRNFDKPVSAVFLVLSDLHFGPHPLSEGLAPVLETPFRGKVSDLITKFFEGHCVAHDLEILTMLPEYLQSCIQRFQRKGFRKGGFNACLLLGDSATFPDARSYNFLLRYLQDGYTSKEAGLGISLDGLQLTRVIGIPGNHDKLLETDLVTYNRNVDPLIPSQPEGRCTAESVHIGDRKFVFLRVDANVYGNKRGMIDLSARNYLAKGEVTSNLIKSALDMIDSTAFNEVEGESSDDQLSRFEKTRIIMLVHYAVDHKEVRANSQSSWQRRGVTLDEMLPHECDGINFLLDAVADRVDLVLHGHWHIPHIYRRGIPVISAGTSSQKDNHENSFFTLAFDTVGDLYVDHHVWKDGAFAWDKTKSRYIGLTRKTRRRTTAG
jgi:3',5'-cyclic AMP phosphodiesterase CpdA